MLTSRFRRGATNWVFLSVDLIGSLQPVDALTKELFVFTVLLCVCASVDAQIMGEDFLFL